MHKLITDTHKFHTYSILKSSEYQIYYNYINETTELIFCIYKLSISAG
jgi:hypothetical protein